MKRFPIIFSIALLLFSHSVFAQGKFLKVQGTKVVKPDGSEFFIKGTNLGNWLCPEGYMFGFGADNAASAPMLETMFNELVGEDYAASFWRTFKDNYITEDDIRFIKSTGANTVRLPLHYKLFTDEDYLGLYSAQDGFERVDKLLGWCKTHGVYVILDMHCAPGGQGGGTVDGGYGYPWLFADTAYQDQLLELWVKIAERYRDNEYVLGYELLNEPIEHRPNEDNWDSLYYPMLEPLYKRITAAIRAVDSNHIILLGGARGNTEFQMFSDWNFDSNIMYTSHCYYASLRSVTDVEKFRSEVENGWYLNGLVEFRKMTGKPIFVGEAGHLTIEQQEVLVDIFRKNNLGYTFWPYKKYALGGCFVYFEADSGWDSIVSFAKAQRGTCAQVRKARPDQTKAKASMKAFVENCKISNCLTDQRYINSIKLK